MDSCGTYSSSDGTSSDHQMTASSSWEGGQTHKVKLGRPPKSCKALMAGLTEDEKKSRRRVVNRESARRMRARRVEYVKHLSDKVEEFEAQYHALQAKNRTITEQFNKMRSENIRLRAQLVQTQGPEDPESPAAVATSVSELSASTNSQLTSLEAALPSSPALLPHTTPGNASLVVPANTVYLENNLLQVVPDCASRPLPTTTTSLPPQPRPPHANFTPLPHHPNYPTQPVPLANQGRHIWAEPLSSLPNATSAPLPFNATSSSLPTNLLTFATNQQRVPHRPQPQHPPIITSGGPRTLPPPTTTSCPQAFPSHTMNINPPQSIHSTNPPQLPATFPTRLPKYSHGQIPTGLNPIPAAHSTRAPSATTAAAAAGFPGLLATSFQGSVSETLEAADPLLECDPLLMGMSDADLAWALDACSRSHVPMSEQLAAMNAHQFRAMAASAQIACGTGYLA